MGQQNLLLLLLVALIVGIAIVSGFKVFKGGMVNSSEDEIRHAMVTVAARAQGWYRRPAIIGGGGHSFSQISFEKINFDSTFATGNILISNQQVGSFQVTGFSKEDSTWQLTLIVYPDSLARIQ